MNNQRILITLLLLVFLASCASAPTETAVPTTTLTPAPAPTATETITPTATPKINLPVDRFQAFPELSQITSENISDLEPVATYSEAQLIRVDVPKAQDRAVVVFNSGVQVYDLPSLTPRPFLPVDLIGSFHNISSNGKYLAVILQELNDQIQIWSLDTQEKLCTFEFPGKFEARGWPLIMEFFPEPNLFLFRGSWVAEDGDSGASEIQLFDLNDCTNVFTGSSDYRPIFSVSPDGSHVAYLENEQVTVLNIEDNTRSSFGESGKILGAGFTTDSRSVIIAYPYTIKIYDLSSGEIINEVESNNGKDPVVYVYALDDGRRILIAWETNNRIWDTETNTSFSLGDEFITIHRDRFDDHPGGLVTWKSVWNLDKKNRVPLTEYPYGSDLYALSQDADLLAVDSGYAPYQTDLLDTSTGRSITAFPAERAPVAVDGETFITSGDGQIFVRSFSGGELLDTLQGEYMNGVALKNRQVLIWNGTGSIAILDVNEGQILQQTSLPVLPLDYGRMPDHYYYQHHFPAWENVLGFDPTNWLASKGRDTLVISPDHTTGIQQSGDVVQIFSIANDKFFPTQENLLASYLFKGVWLRFKFSPDGKQVVGFTNSQLIVWDSQTGRQIRGVYGKSYLQGNQTDFGFSPDGSQVLVSSIGQGGRSLTILDVDSGAQVQSHEVLDCNLNIPYAVTADGSQVFTITQDCRIGLFNIADWQEVKSFGGPYSGAELALALSPDGKFLAAGYKQSLEIWDVDSGKLVKSFNDLDTHIENFIGDFSLAFSPDSKLLAVRYGRWFNIGSTVMLFGVPTAP